MANYALNPGEILPGLTQELLDETKAEVAKALIPYKGRKIDDDLKVSMARQVAGALHRMRRRVGKAPFPSWLTIDVGDTYDELKIGIDYDRIPNKWDPSKIRSALGVAP